MTKKEFERNLHKIGGLENGFTTWPNRYAHPIRYQLFNFLHKIGYSDDKNPFRNKIRSIYFFSIGSGWLQLVWDLISEIVAMGWDKQLCQCKEKFGGLRFYINSATTEIHDKIIEYENKSYNICEHCGKPGILRTDRKWIVTLCDECNNN